MLGRPTSGGSAMRKATLMGIFKRLPTLKLLSLQTVLTGGIFTMTQKSLRYTFLSQIHNTTSIKYFCNIKKIVQPCFMRRNHPPQTFLCRTGTQRSHPELHIIGALNFCSNLRAILCNITTQFLKSNTNNCKFCDFFILLQGCECRVNNYTQIN